METVNEYDDDDMECECVMCGADIDTSSDTCVDVSTDMFGEYCCGVNCKRAWDKDAAIE